MHDASQQPSVDTTSQNGHDDLPPILHLKQAARLLHRQAKERRGEVLKHLRRQPALRALDDDALIASLQRRHCLAAVAQRLGFQGWSHLTAVLSGRESTDFGKLLYPRSASYWNIWSASYDEAQRIRQEHGGFLLPYQRQFLVVDQFFIEALGLDPEDPDWQLMGRDWVQPAQPEARRRLYDKAIRYRLMNS